MASVDRFEFLAEQIISVLNKYRDILAIVGACFAAKVTVKISWQIAKAIRVHCYSRFTKCNVGSRFGKWAVITGCTEGIGLGFAQELASRKINLLLISKDAAPLEETKKELKLTYGVEVKIIVTDFSQGRTVFDEIAKEIEKIEVGILVNNVGVMYDYPMMFLDVSQEKLWQLVNVNVATATILSHLVLPQMAQRHRGAIINLSSSASFLPTPQMTVYAATKAYIDCFSRALNYEYKDHGIIVQTLMPFYVATRMTAFSDTLSRPGLFIPSASLYAKFALRTLEFSSRTTGYWPHTLQYWIACFLPEWLWMWGATRLNNALRRQAKNKLKRKAAHRKSL